MKVRITDKRPDMDEVLIEVLDDKGNAVNVTVAAVQGETHNETSVIVEGTSWPASKRWLFDEPDLGSYDPDEVGGTEEYDL